MLAEANKIDWLIRMYIHHNEHVHIFEGLDFKIGASISIRGLIENPRKVCSALKRYNDRIEAFLTSKSINFGNSCPDLQEMSEKCRSRR